jgi:SAM-dependent methyltransferase
MPSSFHDALAIVVPLVADLRPASILDVGVGFGKYGFLFREYLDVAAAGEDRASPDRSGWAVRIDGIEAHEPYVTGLQRAIYDTIYIGDAAALLPALGRYDLVFAADVLEHFDAAAGRAFLDTAREHAGLGVLVVTPAVHFHQGEVFGNPHEVHRSFWTAADLAAYPGADVMVWRRQLIAFLPAGSRPVRLPRPHLREAAGIVLRRAAGWLWGETRAEVLLDRWRRGGAAPAAPSAPPGPGRAGRVGAK